MKFDDTLEGLARAEEWLNQIEERDSLNDSGNIDKYHSRLNTARGEVRRLRAALKAKGLIPYTEREILSNRLDAAYPQAAKGVIGELDGKRYVKRQRPVEYSRSRKTVYAYETWWELLGDAPAESERSVVNPESARITSALDEKFPNAQSRSIVEFEGARYQRRYAPVTMSKSGRTVREWNAWWEKLD